MQRKQSQGAGTGGHGGNIHLLARNGAKGEIVDFSANINPLGPPEWLRRTVSREISRLVHYPDPDCFDLITAAAEYLQLDAERIIAANGTTELLYALPRIMGCGRAVIPVPSYIDYQKVMEMQGMESVLFPLNAEDGFRLDSRALSQIIRDGDSVILATPNNPTGVVVEAETIIDLADAHRRSWFIIDEAFLDFVEDGKTVAGRRENIITLNSLTKFYAIPGLRLGYGTFPPAIAGKLRRILPPWTVNAVAQAVGARLFGDEDYRRRTLDLTQKLRDELFTHLSTFPQLQIFPSRANYFLVRAVKALSAHDVAAGLLKQSIAIRLCSNYAALDDSYFRVAVRRRQDNRLLIDALHEVVATKPTGVKKRKRHNSLMIQGTSSNAGKSVLVAALCRILLQDGIRVAPFKAQNMSLNSFVTDDGLEMGRAQVVQAQASRLDPDIRMNPVLLKPNSDVGSQVVVEGRPVGNMSVYQYVAYKEQAKEIVCRNFDSLAAEYDAVILEGAGSPGEVNLKHHDIVNMQMARYANSPVLLVGDIDRGGVYASFVGTMEVLEEWERELVAGFIVNRFRGDASLLGPAHSYLLEQCDKRVLGVVPHIPNINIPEEDSVSFKQGKLHKKRPESEHVEIALINLPHISNFTDIEPFLEEPDVYLKIVDTLDDLKEPAAILLPGSKNVMGDLEYLNTTGLGRAVVARARTGCEIVGICGGYQILGKTVADPYFIESDGHTKEGLGLLDISTSLAKDKTLLRREGRHKDSGLAVFGYEIHHGISKGSVSPLLQFSDGSTCGTHHPEMPIWGAYLHGIFDSDVFRRWFIDTLRHRIGLVPLGKIAAPYDLEKAYDNLADIVRHSIDMNAVYHHLGL